MPDTLVVTARQEDAVGVLETKGYINNLGAEKISDACDELMQQGATRFLLDLEGSRIINSIGISILIEVIEKVKEVNGKVVFCNVTPTIAKTFRIMGLLKFATVCDSCDEGIATLSE